MAYTVTPTDLEGVLILDPQVFGDARGYFFESFNARDFERSTGVRLPFVQDGQSRSVRGVLRGLHYQVEHPQGKLVRVTQGWVFDVTVDIRRDSPTFGRWFGIHLSDENKRQLWIPPGLAHGFLVLSDSAEFQYKTTDYWYPEHERCLRWDDPQLAIEWPLAETGRQAPLLADKDARAPSWQAYREDTQTWGTICPK